MKKEYDIIVYGGGVAGVVAAHTACLAIKERVAVANVNLPLMQKKRIS